MISTLSNSASFITVSVGNEVRVREGLQPNTREGQGTSSGKKTPSSTSDTTVGEKVEQPFNKEHVQANVARLQEALKHVDPRVELSLEKDINRVIFRVVDKESGDLIRQIPSEKLVELARFFSGHSGLFVEEKI